VGSVPSIEQIAQGIQIGEPNAQAYTLLALVEETARLADAQDTANKIAALSLPGLLSEKHRASLVAQIGASLYGGEPHA
jgi:hypothetical protein